VGFEQNGIHAHIRIYSTGLSLKDLSAAHFVSITGNKRVERYILGLEGGHFMAVLSEDSTKSGGNETLARI
jgi:hypothetical protein